ncbi:MAG: hypothetical protein GX495_13270 [Chloroflexi bacterium]|nr:hypothetical protein [Chloroflexota bacterium]
MRKNARPAGIVLLLVIIVGAICLFSVFSGGLGSLFGSGRDTLGDRSNPGVLEGEVGNLGPVYAALDVDQNGCPVETAREFFADETVFVGLEESEIPAGTTIFARLYRNGQVVEDSPEVEAGRSTVSCVWFEFAPTGAGFEPGSYEAELIVNGNPVDSVAFEITSSGSGAGALPGTGDLDLGTLYTTTAIDENGCPTDDLAEFFPDERVYVSFSESFIPAGTEMFARLLYQGQAIEDTQPIIADQDTEACVWFEFQGASAGGLQPGNYEVEVYADGSLVDSIDFTVSQ